MNKDLELLATMAIAFIAIDADKLSSESTAILSALIDNELTGDILHDAWNNNDVTVEFVKALNNLKEVTEAYNDLEYSEEE